MVLTFGLLAAAILALWLPGPQGRAGRPWVWLAVAAVVVARSTGVVQPAGFVGIAIWVAVVVAWVRLGGGGKNPAWHWTLAAAVLVLAAALMLHRLPGFANPRVIDAVRFTPDAVPFTLYLNFDKTLIGLLLFALVLPRVASGREWRELLAATWPRAALVLVVVLPASFGLGYVRWAPKLPAEAPLFLGVNLLFTCTAEEALFRGLIQRELRRAWSGWRGGARAALGVAAVLFGAAHAAGGWKYVALATLAGAGYGWIYERTQRVEAGVLAHFALNAAHFLLFTYPALAP